MEYPSEAKYMRVKNYNDKVLARHTTRISPFNGSNFGPSNIDRILFNIPSETGMEIDMDTLMFHFTASITVTAPAGTYDVAFCNSMESIIQNLRIRKGTSFLLEDIQRYNYLDSMFMNYLSKDYNECVGQACMGIGPYSQRRLKIETAQTTESAKRQYCLPFRLSGISNYSGLISTSLIDSVSAFQIEIELAPAADALQANDTTTGAPPTNATYTISEVFLTYDVVRMAPEYHQQLQASIQRGVPLQIPYKTWRTSLYSLPAGAQTNHVFNINDTVKSLNAVFIAFYKQREQGVFTIPGKDRKHKPPTLKSVQLQLGSFYYPLQPMLCEGRAPQAFLELQKALGLPFVRSEYTGPFGFNGIGYANDFPSQVQNLQTGVSVTSPATAAGVTQVAGQFVAPSILYNENGAPLNGPIIFCPAKAASQAAATFTANINAAHDAFTVTAGTVELEPRNGTVEQRCYSVMSQGPASEFVIGFNLRKVLDAVEGEIVGTDIQSSGSGLMSLRLEFSGAVGDTDGPYNIVIASLYDAVLEIQSNQQTFRVE
jgi:hypothetical protein